MFDEYSPLFVQILRDRKLLDAKQISEVEEEHARTGKSIADIIIDFDYFDAEHVCGFVADYLNTEFVDLKDFGDLSEDVINSVPASSARMFEIIPIRLTKESVAIVARDPLNHNIVDELSFVLGKPVELFVALPTQVEELLKKHYGESEESLGDMLQVLDQFDMAKITDGLMRADDIHALEEGANAVPIVKFVNLVLKQAILDKASDIHFEPFEHEFKIRYRVDGALYEMRGPPKQMSLPVTSRIKVMANLDIAERRVPQDGRICLSVAGRQIDLRVSTLPTAWGESCVLRILDRSVVSLDLANIGLPKNIFDDICEIIEKPNGIFVVTGPTGSGKTTTLYSALNRMNSIEEKLLTAEEPVEYDIEGVQQVAINDSIGLTFPRILRSFLRQDPDKIMIGETRDLTTAQIAIQASLTGHLVLTTLHTNDASGAVTRLVDMGVEPFLITTAMEAILAQRLIRKICSACRTPYEPTEEILRQIGLSPSEVGDKQFMYGRGCPVCNNTGYKGRKGIFEMLKMTNPIRELINDRAPAVVIRQKAIELGMISLRQDGLRNIFDGETTIEEILKYT
jgi:type IV pilus assembly protein PilB